MTLDYTSHPAELVEGGELPGKDKAKVTVQDLRNAVPEHCFKPSYTKSLGYLVRDLVISGTLILAALYLIPLMENPWARYAAWAGYGYVQGLAFTGLWVSVFEKHTAHLVLLITYRSSDTNAGIQLSHPRTP